VLEHRAVGVARRRPDGDQPAAAGEARYRPLVALAADRLEDGVDAALVRALADRAVDVPLGVVDAVISTQLPAAGEMVLFDRSWYNRATVSG